MILRSTLRATTALFLLSSGMAWAEATHPVTGEILASDQSLIYRVGSEIASIDPALVAEPEGLAIVRDLFEGLMNQDADGNPIPGVARDYTVSEDGLTYTFNLRPARWSNGDPVTASDFEFAWKRAASPVVSSPFSWYLDLMAIENAAAVIAGDMDSVALGVTAIDDQTLQVRLSRPVPYFPRLLVHPVTFPVHAPTVLAYGDAWTLPENIVSNGAYVLTDHKPQEKSVRSRSGTYWNADHTILQTVTALVIKDASAALTRYLSGELDQTEVPAGQFPRLSTQFPAQTVAVPFPCSYYYTINLGENGNPALQDADVRQALSLAIDRDRLVATVLAGGQMPAYTLTHWATADFDMPAMPAVAMTQDARNVQAATLLADAGYNADNPLTVDLLYNTSDAHDAVAVAISKMWQETLGVTTDLRNQDWQDFMDTRGNQDYQIARGSTCADYNAASAFLKVMRTGADGNHAEYTNPRVDGLLAAALVSDDPGAAYSEIEMILAAEMPIIPIFHFAVGNMIAEDIKGWPLANLQQSVYSRDLYRIAE